MICTVLSLLGENVSRREADILSFETTDKRLHYESPKPCISFSVFHGSGAMHNQQKSRVYFNPAPAVFQEFDCDSALNSLYTVLMIIAAMMKVRISAAGKDQSRPSSPMKTGIMIGRNTPNMISRDSETAVESPAFPSACR